MGLRSLELKSYYDPALDGRGLEEEFYGPCLKNSISYSRVSAYFSAAILKKISKGLAVFWKNGGKARFIFSTEVSERDLRDIENGYRERAMKHLSEALAEQERHLIGDENVANLSYLISIGAVEVKICFMFQAAIMHMKMGVFKDADGEIVAFSGSGNETVSGIERNSEQFHVFTSFQGSPTDSSRVTAKDEEKRFERIWNNEYAPDKCVAITPEGELIERLISYSKGRVFMSKKEFLSVCNEVYIDIDSRENMRILLFDYAPNRPLSSPRGLSSKMGSEWHEADADSYWIGLTIHNLRDRVKDYLDKYDIPYRLSAAAQKYLEDQDLEIDKRLKLGRAIKRETERDRWQKEYDGFKSIVDEGTNPERHLKDRQMLSAFHHAEMKCSADFSVPGTGKTYIAYGMFAYLSDGRVDKANRLVVLGPISSFRAWKLEGDAIFKGKRRLSFFDASEAKGDWRSQIYDKRHNVILINYEKFNDETEVGYLADYLFTEKTMLVLDEAHRVKGRDSVRAQNLLKALRKAKHRPTYRLCLTGTPMPNSFVDLMNMIEILYPDDLDSFPILKDRYRLKRADEDSYGGREEALEAEKELDPIFMRTTKKMLSVPAPNPDDFSSLAMAPTEDEERLYQEIWETEKPLSRYIRLIQAASNPRLLSEKITRRYIEGLYEYDDEKGGMPEFKDDDIRETVSDSVLSLAKNIRMASKTALALKKIESLVKEGKKVLVWCLFIDTISMVSKYLKDHGIECVTVTGSDGPSERNDKIDAFRGPSCQALITNPNTLAESVSLHRECHDAVYLEYGFNLTYMLQSKDRINRVGLPSDAQTNYYFAIAKSDGVPMSGPIDERILERLKMKEKRMLNAIEEGRLGPAFDEDELEDIKYILRKS